jgi:hypothetical protein
MIVLYFHNLTPLISLLVAGSRSLSQVSDYPPLEVAKDKPVGRPVVS